MRMKKLLMFLVLLTVSVGTWAGVTWTKLADSNSQASNGKGFTYDHTTYLINVENPGDLSSADITAIPQAGNEYNKANMNTGTYFVFTGELSAADLAKLDASFGSSSYDVYFDFSGATFSNNVSIANLSSSTLAKYIILPDNTTSIPSADSDYPESVMEVMAINQSTGSVLAYSDPNSAKTMEKLLAFDNRFKNDAIVNCTLVGIYSHNSSTTLQQNGISYYDTVFTLLATAGGGGYKFKFKNFDLTDAKFPNYGITSTYTIQVQITTSTGVQQTVTVEKQEDTNALETMFIYGTRYGSNSLESVLLPETEETTLIPHTAFLDCTKLTSLDIPGNIEKLGLSAFSGCSGLTSLTFHEGLTEMSSNVFYNCSNLPTITLPIGLTNIGEYAFTNCEKITSIILPEGVTRIQNGAFEMTNIASIRLPSTLEYIEDNVFRQCNNLTTITFPKNLKQIGSNCFFNCNHLTDVYFLGDDPNNIPIVPANAFDTKAYNANNACYGEITAIDHTNYGDYDLSRVNTENISSSLQKEYSIDWDSWQSNDAIAGYHAAVLHYPLVTRDAEYSTDPINNVQAYIDAQSVTVPDLYYTEDNGVTYKKLNGTPTSGVNYFTRSTQGAGTYTSTNTSEPGITQYYSDQNGTAATPFVSCNNGTSYYLEDGKKDVWSDAVYEPQLYNGELVTTYYTKDNNTGEYIESPYMYFSSTKYYNQVQHERTKYNSTQSLVDGVEHYYTDNTGLTEATPGFYQTYYYNPTESHWIPTGQHIQGVEHYYSDEGNTIATPEFWSSYFYKDSNDEWKSTSVFIDGVSDYYSYGWNQNVEGYYIPDNISFKSSVYYYNENQTITNYSSTNSFVSGFSTYYSLNNGSYTVVDNIQFNGQYYYPTNETEIYYTYNSTDKWLPEVSTYYSDENGTEYYNGTIGTDAWPGGAFNNAYYYITGKTKNYTSACGNEYDPSKTYYTDNNGSTVASSVQFDQTYYYENTTYAYTQVPTATIDQIILKQTSLYAKDGDTYTKVNAEDVVASGTYYLCTVEGSDDVLGEYYTVPERNATYGGVWVGEDTPEAKHNVEGNWPCQQDLWCWLGDGEALRRTGLPSPDGLNHDGTKNFLISSGYSPTEQTFEKAYKNVWYTMCFPFNLTKDMLNSAFNPEYEICEFSGVTVDATNKAITLHFTGVVTETDGFMTKAYHPYMIHPNLGPSALNTPATCTFVGINEIDEETENVSVGDGSASILGQSVVKSSDSYEGVQGTFTFQGNVSSEKKVIPYGAYFLGTAEGQIYPKFWRESSKVQDRDRGLWSQYSAILLSDQVLEMKMFNNNTSAIDNYVKSFDIDFSDFISEDALAIEKIVKEAEEKNLPVQYMNIVYDINGKLIQKGDASLENLPSGLYIVNGKKYLVK